MDTSFDQSSLTLDFMLGNGINFPKPTDEDMAQLLFAKIADLREQGDLADIIGNRPATAHENYRLAWALDEKQDTHVSHFRSYRAREVLSAVRLDPKDRSVALGEDYLYVACTHTHSVWLLVTHINASNKLSQLTVESMVDFFSYRHDWAQHIGLKVLSTLTQLAREEADRWEEKARRMNTCMTTLDNTTKRVRSAFTQPRTSGTGIEG